MSQLGLHGCLAGADMSVARWRISSCVPDLSTVDYYHENFQDDRRLIKALVYGLALLDVLQTVMVTADAFHWFVYGFGNMDTLDETFLNSWDVPVLDAVISLVVQAFYCWRIHFLQKTIVVPVLILLVSITQCVAGIVTGVRAHQLGHLSLISTEVVPQTVWLVGGAVADVAIAGVLSWALLTQRKHTLPTSAARTVISRIIRLVVETNALTAGVAVIALILFWGVPQHSTLVVPPTAIIGKLYTNCLIALFNNRLKDPKPTSAHGMQSVHLPDSSSHGHGRTRSQHNGNGNGNCAPSRCTLCVRWICRTTAIGRWSWGRCRNLTPISH
ncbi:hypothetical protein B0H19DRAFT_1161573, partial [Mycena capillaripes]